MLTIKAIESAKPRDKAYKLPDYESLYLFVATTGVKSWRLDYSFTGKRKTLTIGKYPGVSLSEARSEKEKAKRMLSLGVDPGEDKKKKSAPAENSLPTFRELALEWHDAKKASWTKKYANEIISIFERDVFPYIGNDPISNIKPLAMLTVLKNIEKRGALEIAKKARMRCGEVFRYAIVTGRAELNPATELSSAMAKAQPKNFPFLATDAEMSDFLKALKGYSGNVLTRYATLLLIYTVPRTSELLSMRWANVNWSERVVTIDAEFVKKDRVHLIPLSNQAFDILKFLQPITGDGAYIFPNRNDPSRPMSNGAILQVIRRLGFANRASGHGFRHQFSSVLNEHGFNRDWIEKQLNHEEGSVRGIYNHAQYLDGRREMMQWYADYIDNLDNLGR